MNPIEEGLQALARAERRVPSPEIEATLLRACHRAAQARRRRIAVMAGALAAALAGVLFLMRPQAMPVVTHAQPVIAAAKPLPVQTAPVAASRPRHRKVRRPTQTAAVEFIPIPYAAPLDAGERAQLLRVSMPVTTLTSWGFQIDAGDPDRVINADVVVGENGLARAVRLIR